MDEKFKAEFAEAVKNAVELDTLSEEDYACIVEICRRANDRAAAEISERIMIDAVGGTIQ